MQFDIIPVYGASISSTCLKLCLSQVPIFRFGKNTTKVLAFCDRMFCARVRLFERKLVVCDEISFQGNVAICFSFRRF